MSTVLSRIADESLDIRVGPQVGDYGLWLGESGRRCNRLVEKLASSYGSDGGWFKA